MSYSEQNGQVVLRMSRDDFDSLQMLLGAMCNFHIRRDRKGLGEFLEFCNRLNAGNPDYTPYQVEEKKS